MRGYFPKLVVFFDLGSPSSVELRFGSSSVSWVFQLVGVGDRSRHVLMSPARFDLHISRRDIRVM